MDASESQGSPVEGLTWALYSNFSKSANLVVAKIGAEPLYVLFPLVAWLFWGAHNRDRATVKPFVSRRVVHHFGVKPELI